jgi:flagellar export protein FliJ
MSGSHHFTLQKIMDLREKESLQALERLQHEEKERHTLEAEQKASRQRVKEAYDSFQLDHQSYHQAIHFPLYIQQQRNYEVQIQERLLHQNLRCEQAKARYIESKIKAKSLEKLKGKQAQKWSALQARQEALNMDEMGLRSFYQSP